MHQRRFLGNLPGKFSEKNYLKKFLKKFSKYISYADIYIHKPIFWGFSGDFWGKNSKK